MRTENNAKLVGRQARSDPDRRLGKFPSDDTSSHADQNARMTSPLPGDCLATHHKPGINDLRTDLLNTAERFVQTDEPGIGMNQDCIEKALYIGDRFLPASILSVDHDIAQRTMDPDAGISPPQPFDQPNDLMTKFSSPKREQVHQEVIVTSTDKARHGALPRREHIRGRPIS